MVNRLSDDDLLTFTAMVRQLRQAETVRDWLLGVLTTKYGLDNSYTITDDGFIVTVNQPRPMLVPLVIENPLTDGNPDVERQGSTMGYAGNRARE